MCLYNVVVEFGGDIKKIIKNKTLKNFIRFSIVFCITCPHPLSAIPGNVVLMLSSA